MVTKAVRVVRSKHEGDFEMYLKKALNEMEENVEVRVVDVQFSSSSDSLDTYFTALVIGKGI
jgi:hypothetical protein